MYTLHLFTSSLHKSPPRLAAQDKRNQVVFICTTGASVSQPLHPVLPCFKSTKLINASKNLCYSWNLQVIEVSSKYKILPLRSP